MGDNCNIAEIQEEKGYTLGPLTAREIFPMASIVGKIGIRQITEYLTGNGFEGMALRLKGMFEKKTEESAETVRGNQSRKQDQEKSTMEFLAGVSVAANIVDIVIQHIPDCKKEILQILSNLSGLSKEEVEALRADIFFEMIIDVVRKEEFINFYRVATKFIK